MNSKFPGLPWSMNCSDGGVVETSRMFHAASAAFIHPARSPTRGSGLGAAAGRSSLDEAHAAHSAAIASTGTNERDCTETPVEEVMATRGASSPRRSLCVEPGEFPLLVHIPLVLLVVVDADLGRVIAAHGPPLELIEEALRGRFGVRLVRRHPGEDRHPLVRRGLDERFPVELAGQPVHRLA